MAYKRQDFENNKVLSAEQLNYMEDGIVTNESGISELRTVVADLIIRIQKLEEGSGEEEIPEGIELVYIICTYDGGDVPIGIDVNDLTGITVMGTYSNGVSIQMNEYTLEGTIEEGINTITVNCQGKTATFEVKGLLIYSYDSLYEGALSPMSMYGYEKMYAETGQDGSISEGLCFRADANGVLTIRDMATNSIVKMIDLDKKDILLPHSNSVCSVSGTGNGKVALEFKTGTTISAGNGKPGTGTRATTDMINLAQYPGFSFTITSGTFIVCCYDENGTYLGQVKTSLDGFATSAQWITAGTIITENLLTSLGAVAKVAFVHNLNAVPTYTCTANIKSVALYSNIYNTYASESDKHIGECCVYEIPIIEEEEKEDENKIVYPTITFELGNLNSNDGGESDNTGRRRSNYIDITSIPDSKITVNGGRYLVACYDSSGAYLGQINATFTQLVVGSGQWLNDGTSFNISALTTANAKVTQIRLLVQSVSPYMEVLIDDVLVNLGGNPVSNSSVNWGTTLSQIIKIGFINNAELWAPASGNARPYGNFVVDEENRYLYAYVMYTTKNATYWHKFNLPELSAGEYNETYGCNVVTLTEDDILDSWQTSYQNYIQGVTCHEGKIWCTEGLGTSTSTGKLKVVDPSAEGEREIAVFDLDGDGLTGEPEFISFYNNVCYLGNLSNVYKINLF